MQGGRCCEEGEYIYELYARLGDSHEQSNGDK